MGLIVRDKVKDLPCIVADLFHDMDGKLRSEEHTSELQSQSNLVCRLLLEKKKNPTSNAHPQGVRRAANPLPRGLLPMRPRFWRTACWLVLAPIVSVELAGVCADAHVVDLH